MTRISARYLGKRLVYSYVTILVIMTLLFALVRSMPGDFVTAMTGPTTPAGVAERLRDEWGLNQPMWKQYLSFMINYHTFNFGWSPSMNAPVSAIVTRRLPRTMILFGAVYIVGTIMGPLIGMYLGWWRGSFKDRSVFTTGLMAYSIPSFWLAWLIIWLVNYRLEWLPTSYMITQFIDEWGLYGQYGVTHWTVMVDVFRHILAPFLSIVLIGWVGTMLIMRTNMNNVVDSEYVDLARAKGLSERTVLLKHAARTALIPVATGAIVGIVTILDGSVIIENVFNWPGVGDLIVDAVLGRDYPLAQALFYVLAILIVVMRLITDVVYTYLDPRIKFGGEN